MYLRTESMSNLGPKIWDLVPSNLKEICDLDKFKKSLNSGNLRIVLVDRAKFLYKMLVFWTGKNNFKEVAI